MRVFCLPPPLDMKKRVADIFQRVSFFSKTSRSSLGASLIEFAILIPILLLIAGAVFDLARLFINSISAREIAIESAKLLNSSSPAGYAFTHQEMQQFYFAPEQEHGDITSRRVDFWNNQLNEQHEDFYGLTYFPRKDKQVLNLAYGLLHNASPHLYFPIPEPLNQEDPLSDLGGRTNCSIRIRFADEDQPPAQSSWPGDPVDLAELINESRDRLVNVRCAVPVIGFQIMTLGEVKVKYIEAEVYVYRAGGIAE